MIPNNNVSKVTDYKPTALHLPVVIASICWFTVTAAVITPRKASVEAITEPSSITLSRTITG